MKDYETLLDLRAIHDAPSPLISDEFPNAFSAMLEKHRPSRMPFFKRLAAMPSASVAEPHFLGKIHLLYQSTMHATRAAVYYLPYLDAPALRKRKLQIFTDD